MTFDQQGGFDFGDMSEALQDEAAGTWLDPKFTAAQYGKLFADAEIALAGIVGVWRGCFEAGLLSAIAGLAEQLAFRDDDGQAFSLWTVKVEVSADDLERMLAHHPEPSPYPGLLFKYRKTSLLETCSIFIEGAGTLTVRRWTADNFSAEYEPYKSTAFLDSYKDSMPRVALSSKVWGVGNNCQRLGESGGGIASLAPFEYNGRLYASNGGVYSSAGRETQGWRLTSLIDWHGPTYTYSSALEAFDSGCKERGDLRGLVVLVNRQKCVFEAATVFYETGPEQ